MIQSTDKVKFPAWLSKPPPHIEKLLTDMPDEVYHTLVKEVIALAKPYFEAEAAKKIFGMIDTELLGLSEDGTFFAFEPDVKTLRQLKKKFGL